MKIALIACTSSLVVLLSGCAPTNVTIAHTATGHLPKSCQIASVLKLDKQLQAWDKTDLAKQKTELNCLIGYPNSDMAFSFDYSLTTAAQWEKIYKKAMSGSGNLLADTVTSENLPTVYEDYPAEGNSSVDVKVFDHGVLLDYYGTDKYSRKDPLLLDALREIVVN